MITIVLPYYMNQGMLKLQYEGWASWPQELKDQFEIVLVDDCSPNDQRAIDVERPEGLPKLRIYCVKKDIPWHQHGARNLGADQAEGEWLLLTDIDHVLPQKSAERLVKRLQEGALSELAIYIPPRVEADTGLPTMKNGTHKPHPNSFVMTKDLFWKIGGYDEDFCGHYGTDALFKMRAARFANSILLKGCPLVRYWRDIIPDASTTTLPRKEGREDGFRKRIMAEKAARGEADVVKVLQFDWERQL